MEREPLDEVYVQIDDVEYRMRRQEELSAADYLKFGRLSNRLAVVSQYANLPDESEDDEDEPPEEIAVAYATALRRIARIGFPDVPREVWPTLSATEVMQLANRFTAEMQRETVSRVHLVNPTPAGSSMSLPNASDIMEPATLVSGSISTLPSVTGSSNGSARSKRKSS